MAGLRQFMCVLGLIAILLIQSCSMPHNYENEYKAPNRALEGAFLGGFTGLTTSAAFTSSVPTGVLVGVLAGGGLGLAADSRYGTLYRLALAGVRVIEYGENVMVVLPSDMIFYPNSSRLKTSSYPYLVEVAGFMQNHAVGPITIEAYSDNIGSWDHKQTLTQTQAQSVLAYMWAHGLNMHAMRAVGYGEKPDAASNLTVEGSAMNRRVEIYFRFA